jgi:hypothetical protein
MQPEWQAFRSSAGRSSVAYPLRNFVCSATTLEIKAPALPTTSALILAGTSRPGNARLLPPV